MYIVVGWLSIYVFDEHRCLMLPEERTDPSLLVEDLKAGSATPGPRLQRLAKASGQPETEVAMLVMQARAPTRRSELLYDAQPRTVLVVHVSSCTRRAEDLPLPTLRPRPYLTRPGARDAV